MIDAVVIASVVAGAAIGGLRWLRVAQREHYVPGRVAVIAALWLTRSRVDVVLAILAGLFGFAATVASLAAPDVPALALLALPAAALAAVVPLGLPLRGRTSRLAWTGRLKRLAVGWGVLLVATGAGLWWAAGPGSTALLVSLYPLPLTLDVALRVMDLVERRLSKPFVVKAQRRLARVRPQVVAVTGSYGKTSTKGYIAHALSGSRSVVASPASFNNRLGLSRAVNDHLVDGTEVFVAEMGTFGPGEIRELCELFPPDVAVITTIGEAHLERMRTRENVLAAKSEITERAKAAVLPVDDPLLAALAERLRAAGTRVVTCSVEPGTPAAEGADVVVDLAAGIASVRTPEGTEQLAVDEVPHAVNVAVAIGVALALDVAPATLRLHGLPRAAHRAEVHAGSGVAVVDDTYNANPVGALAALQEAAALAAERGGPLVVVTPGIVELGPVQRERNAAFAEAVVTAGARLVVVGRTNRAALLEGAARAGGTADIAERREPAVTLATSVAGERGVVLYENDLPDHYP